MALADTARLIASLELDPRKFLKGVAKSEKALSRIENRGYRAGAQIATGMQNIARASVGVAASLAAVGVASLKMAGDFEAQLNTINTIARETPEGLDRIGDSIRKIARDTGTPLEDLTAGYYDLLSAGIKAADAQKVLEASNRLAIGGLSTTAESVDLLTTTLNTYGIEASKAASVADIFAAAIERGKVTAADLASSFAQIGPIAAASGISLEEVSAAFARLTASGVPAAEAATQMRSAIVALTKRTKPLEKLEDQFNRNYLAIAGKKGLVAALEIMRKDAKKAGVPLIDLLGRVEGLNFTLATTGTNFDEYNADLKAMGDASGTAAAQMAERQQGLNFQIARLKSLAKDAGITIGSELLPKITPLFERFNKFIGDNQGAIKDFGVQLAGLFSPSNIAAGVDAIKEGFQIAKDAAPVIADAAKITGSALKVAIDAFKSLPPDFQKLIVAGLALNKITGGLVTNIAGGLISAVLKQLVSGVVNVAGGVVNVTGPGGLPGAPVPGAPTPPGTPGISVPRIGAAVVIDKGWLFGEVVKTRTAILEVGKKVTTSAALSDSRDSIQTEKQVARQIEIANRIRTAAAEEQRRGERTVQTLEAAKASQAASFARQIAATNETRRETARGANQTAAAARNAGERARQAAFATRDAVNAKDLSVKIFNQNTVRISIRDMLAKTTFQSRMAEFG